jgi:uncharacterized membrane protein
MKINRRERHMTEEMEMADLEISENDRFLAALSYALSPLFPIVILLFMPDKKDRPFIRSHNIQALILGIFLWIIFVPATIGCGSLAWFLMLYWAYKAYQGEHVEIPVVTEFVKNQSW